MMTGCEPAVSHVRTVRNLLSSSSCLFEYDHDDDDTVATVTLYSSTLHHTPSFTDSLENDVNCIERNAAW